MTLTTDQPAPGSQRLLSLDVYRGLIMFLLIGEGAAFYHALHEIENPTVHAIARQFHHVDWRGLRLWDLVQPGFMFIVGVAMALSIHKRLERGDSWGTTFRHILIRCAILFVLGVGLHCVYAGELVFELWNVLTQLSFTILVAFLLFQFPWQVQLSVSLALILATDLAYRSVHVPPFDQTFGPSANFGTYVDTLLMGKTNSGHWVALNAVPTAAHTIWGVLCGQLLYGPQRPTRKVLILLGSGVALIVLGHTMDLVGIAPIVKRICTSSFVIAAGGWCIATLAVFYWIYDIRNVRFGTWFLVVVGMNPILIYMITELLAWGWLNPRVGIFVGSPLQAVGVSATLAALISAAVTWALLWALCAWLYQRRIFIRI